MGGGGGCGGGITTAGGGESNRRCVVSKAPSCEYLDWPRATRHIGAGGGMSAGGGQTQRRETHYRRPKVDLSAYRWTHP